MKKKKHVRLLSDKQKVDLTKNCCSEEKKIVTGHPARGQQIAEKKKIVTGHPARGLRRVEKAGPLKFPGELAQPFLSFTTAEFSGFAKMAYTERFRTVGLCYFFFRLIIFVFSQAKFKRRLLFSLVSYKQTPFFEAVLQKVCSSHTS